MSPTTPATGRRTQAQRSSAARAALLDATIDCLVQDGYARTSIRRVSERAGLTIGAQQHHFATKQALVSEAVVHLATRMAADFVQHGLPDGRTEAERAEQLLDRIWHAHRGPLFEAAVELWVAARTDPGLQQSLTSIGDGITDLVEAGAAALFPQSASRPDFQAALVTGLATLRGLALQGFLPGFDPDEAWPATRAHLLALLHHVAEAEV